MRKEAKEKESAYWKGEQTQNRTRTHTHTHTHINTLNGTSCAASGCAASIVSESSFHRFCDANNLRSTKSHAGSVLLESPLCCPVPQVPNSLSVCPNLASQGSESPLPALHGGEMNQENAEEWVIERHWGKESVCVCVCVRVCVCVCLWEREWERAGGRSVWCCERGRARQWKRGSGAGDLSRWDLSFYWIPAGSQVLQCPPSAAQGTTAAWCDSFRLKAIPRHDTQPPTAYSIHMAWIWPSSAVKQSQKLNIMFLWRLAPAEENSYSLVCCLFTLCLAACIGGFWWQIFCLFWSCSLSIYFLFLSHTFMGLRSHLQTTKTVDFKSDDIEMELDSARFHVLYETSGPWHTDSGKSVQT